MHDIETEIESLHVCETNLDFAAFKLWIALHFF